MLQAALIQTKPLDPRKFKDPHFTAKGDKRATVGLTGLRTLWFNTGSLCNITCKGCYMESGPTNDRLAYLSAAEVSGFLDEIERNTLPVEEIGFTGGEPFMNADFLAILGDALERGFKVLVLTNAMQPLTTKRRALLHLRDRLGAARLARNLTLRVSIDHFTPDRHEQLRGARSWKPMLNGLAWLAGKGFTLAAAGRQLWDEREAEARAGYAGLFAREGLPIDAADRAKLVLFPEMDPAADVPEITEACWDILNVSPDAMMCASSRMVVKRRGAAAAAVVPCTLLPYDPSFDLGPTLAKASGEVSLNHPHCARFCVLGGASCSAA
jgi:hypothetical protein